MIGYTLTDHKEVLPRHPCYLTRIGNSYSLQPLIVYTPVPKTFKYNTCFQWSPKKYMFPYSTVLSYAKEELAEYIRDNLISQYLRLPKDDNIYLYRDIHTITATHLTYRVRQLDRENMEWIHTTKPISSMYPLELQDVSEHDRGLIAIANLTLD